MSSFVESIVIITSIKKEFYKKFPILNDPINRGYSFNSFKKIECIKSLNVNKLTISPHDLEKMMNMKSIRWFPIDKSSIVCNFAQ